MRTSMEYIVPLGILVAFLAWIVATFSRLHHLHSMAHSAWAKWSAATQYRNECVTDFTTIFSGYVPGEDLCTQDLRRLADDSRRSLDAHRSMPEREEAHRLGLAEKSMRRVVMNAVQTMEDSQAMRSDAHLAELCTRVSLSLFQQDELTRSYNRSVGNFNLALAAPGARLVAGMFGFTPLEEIR